MEWTKRTILDLLDILEFYLQRNGNSIFRQKLNTRITESVKLLAKNPFSWKTNRRPSHSGPWLLAIIKSSMRFLKS